MRSRPLQQQKGQQKGQQQKLTQHLPPTCGPGRTPVALDPSTVPIQYPSALGTVFQAQGLSVQDAEKHMAQVKQMLVDAKVEQDRFNLATYTRMRVLYDIFVQLRTHVPQIPTTSM